jgi:putative oxidoreductase
MSAVGYWVVHAPNGLYPIVNGGETIILYTFIFLFIATRGAGMWSIDASRSKD